MSNHNLGSDDLYRGGDFTFAYQGGEMVASEIRERFPEMGPGAVVMQALFELDAMGPLSSREFRDALNGAWSQVGGSRQ